MTNLEKIIAMAEKLLDERAKTLPPSESIPLVNRFADAQNTLLRLQKERDMNKEERDER